MVQEHEAVRDGGQLLREDFQRDGKRSIGGAEKGTYRTLNFHVAISTPVV